MTDTATHLSLDNYAQLLAFSDLAIETGRCAACGPDAVPMRTDALWVLHDRTDSRLRAEQIVCSRHAAAWSRTGIVPRLA